MPGVLARIVLQLRLLVLLCRSLQIKAVTPSGYSATRKLWRSRRLPSLLDGLVSEHWRNKGIYIFSKKICYAYTRISSPKPLFIGSTKWKRCIALLAFFFFFSSLVFVLGWCLKGKESIYRCLKRSAGPISKQWVYRYCAHIAVADLNNDNGLCTPLFYHSAFSCSMLICFDIGFLLFLGKFCVLFSRSFSFVLHASVLYRFMFSVVS